MTERSVTHATFAIERTYDAAPARVFAAWADPEAKARWFSCRRRARPRAGLPGRRAGAQPRRRAGRAGVHLRRRSTRTSCRSERIVYTYDMRRDDARISVSLATVEFKPAGAGTRMVFTEQGAFLDGHDTPAQREHGTRVGLERLDAELQRDLAGV